jgi:adenosine deaminase
MEKMVRAGGSCLLVLGMLAAQLAWADYQGPTRPTLSGVVCTDPNRGVDDYDEVIKSHPRLIEAFRAFPKGADIHNHLSGSIQPKDYIRMGAADRDCYGPANAAMYRLATRDVHGNCADQFTPISAASREDKGKIVKSLSMSGYAYPNIQGGHDQFFATFGRFGPVSGPNTAPMLATLLQEANTDSVSYVETMMSFQSPAVSELGDKLRQAFSDESSYTNSAQFLKMYTFLQENSLNQIVLSAQKDITRYIHGTKGILKCGTHFADPACRVSYAFLAAVNRNATSKTYPKSDNVASLAQVFAQTAFAMQLAATDDRVVGVNLLSGEDADLSMGNFAPQMQFFLYFHGVFPKANIALHAGELTPCFVGPQTASLKDHLMESLRAGAKRIGHGVSFEYLSPSDQSEVVGMITANNALVEIMFASNAQILGVAGAAHPFLQYAKYGVPLAFATDDEGVSYGDFTNEWVYGYVKYGLKGSDLIRLGRESLQHSFIKGQPLWSNLRTPRTVPECANVIPGIPNPPEPCNTYLKENTKAKAQWAYEARLQAFLQSQEAKKLGLKWN